MKATATVEKDVKMVFRISSHLRTKMKTYLASKNLTIQDWLTEVIEKNLKN